MTYIPDKLRDFVTERANGLCEYCKAPLFIVLAVEVDHIKAESRGGTTTEDNLCLVCRQCNRSKSYFLTGLDPESGEEIALFNPRLQNWHEHFSWNDDSTVVLALTATGRATLKRLNINREVVVKARRFWLKAGWQPG